MRRRLVVALVIVSIGGAACGGQMATPPKIYQTEGYALARLTDGRILVTGGIRYGTGKVNTAQLCDPATFTYSLTTPMHDTRTGHTATTLRDGRVLVVGGASDALFQSEARHSAELYDAATGRWAKAAATAAPRYLHTATLLADGRVLVIGGRFFDGAGADYLASAEIYDPTANTWQAVATLSERRAGQMAVLLADGRVFVAGGETDWQQSRTQGAQTAELYDPAMNRWQRVTDPRWPGTSGDIGALLADGRVLLFHRGHRDESEIYDIAADRWEQISDPSSLTRYLPSLPCTH